MKFEFDPRKDAINTEKHGVSLADAALLEWGYMRIKSKSGRVFELPSDQEEADINAGIAEDQDTRELTDQEFQQLRPIGRPKADVTKERITIRLSPDVVEKFRATGSGWQTRMDHALQEYLKTHSQSDIERLG